jgi:hypothetical protein
MGRQSFQRGQMIWRSDDISLLVLYDSGTWQHFRDEWREGQPESDPGLQAPEGLEQPIRGFGKLWRETLGGPQAGIGWATEQEQGGNGTLQDWQGGTLFHFGAESLAVFNDGTWQRRP